MTGEPILVVDDNPQNLKLVRVLLMTEGYAVRTAVDGEDAVRVLESFMPRLILMDLQLPGMDGLELTRRLKADPKMKGTVAVTSGIATWIVSTTERPGNRRASWKLRPRPKTHWRTTPTTSTHCAC